jgi:hypothetical protein
VLAHSNKNVTHRTGSQPVTCPGHITPILYLLSRKNFKVIQNLSPYGFWMSQPFSPSNLILVFSLHNISIYHHSTLLNSFKIRFFENSRSPGHLLDVGCLSNIPPSSRGSFQKGKPKPGQRLWCRFETFSPKPFLRSQRLFSSATTLLLTHHSCTLITANWKIINVCIKIIRRFSVPKHVRNSSTPPEDSQTAKT